MLFFSTKAGLLFFSFLVNWWLRQGDTPLKLQPQAFKIQIPSSFGMFSLMSFLE